jgi:hypothetical protein
VCARFIRSSQVGTWCRRDFVTVEGCSDESWRANGKYSGKLYATSSCPFRCCFVVRQNGYADRSLAS